MNFMNEIWLDILPTYIIQMRVFILVYSIFYVYPKSTNMRLFQCVRILSNRSFCELNATTNFEVCLPKANKFAHSHQNHTKILFGLCIHRFRARARFHTSTAQYVAGCDDLESSAIQTRNKVHLDDDDDNNVQFTPSWLSIQVRIRV